jgi:hypothetical protein
MATNVNRPPGFYRSHLIEKNIAENNSIYVLTEIDSRTMHHQFLKRLEENGLGRGK